MTRINVIPPDELSRLHLIAEYRELPRIFSLVRKAQERGEIPNLNAVPEYTLGKGHVRFFYPRLGWLVKRQAMLVDEMLKRGYYPNFATPNIEGVAQYWFGDWEVTEQSLIINRARIKERS